MKHAIKDFLITQEAEVIFACDVWAIVLFVLGLVTFCENVSNSLVRPLYIFGNGFYLILFNAVFYSYDILYYLNAVNLIYSGFLVLACWQGCVSLYFALFRQEVQHEPEIELVPHREGLRRDPTRRRRA